jgi:N-acetyl-gamma-glutamyl-phosphate reductase
MIHASIAGADSDVAGELIRILLYHPDVEITGICAPTLAGKALDEVHHGMIGDTDLRFSSSIDFTKTNVVFICAPQPDSFYAELPEDLRIVDLTNSHINDGSDYVYGICELNRKPLVRGAIHAALPSAVAQSVLLSLLPLANTLLLNSDITIRSSLTVTNQDILEVETVVKALQLSFNRKLEVSAEPLVGANRAMFTEVSFDCSLNAAQVVDMFNEFYDDHNFTFVIARKPVVSDVANTNKCIVNIDKDGDRLTITAAIDPHIKGAAGTAAHCMNLLFGLHERVGLTLKPSLE